MFYSFKQCTLWVSVSHILKSEPVCTSHKPKTSYQRWQVHRGLQHGICLHAATQSYLSITLQPVSYRDEHSAPFGWRTRSQQNLHFDMYGEEGEGEGEPGPGLDRVTSRRWAQYSPQHYSVQCITYPGPQSSPAHSVSTPGSGRGRAGWPSLSASLPCRPHRDTAAWRRRIQVLLIHFSLKSLSLFICFKIHKE